MNFKKWFGHNTVGAGYLTVGWKTLSPISLDPSHPPWPPFSPRSGERRGKKVGFGGGGEAAAPNPLFSSPPRAAQRQRGTKVSEALLIFALP